MKRRLPHQQAKLRRPEFCNLIRKSVRRPIVRAQGTVPAMRVSGLQRSAFDLSSWTILQEFEGKPKFHRQLRPSHTRACCLLHYIQHLILS